MAQKPKPQSDDRETVPFNEALRRLINTPPKPKQSSGGGGRDKPRPSKTRKKKPR